MSTSRRRHERYKVSAKRLVNSVLDLPTTEQKIVKTLATMYRRTIGDVFRLYIHMDRNTSNTKQILNLTSKS